MLDIFVIIADKVTDSSNKEQLVVCFRSVDDNFQPTEEFVGLHHVESINADALVGCLKDTMLRMNLIIEEHSAMMGQQICVAHVVVLLHRFVQKSQKVFSCIAMVTHSIWLLVIQLNITKS